MLRVAAIWPSGTNYNLVLTPSGAVWVVPGSSPIGPSHCTASGRFGGRPNRVNRQGWLCAGTHRAWGGSGGVSGVPYRRLKQNHEATSALHTSSELRQCVGLGAHGDLPTVVCMSLVLQSSDLLLTVLKKVTKY